MSNARVVETIYLGPASSSHPVCAQDKRAQLPVLPSQQPHGVRLRGMHVSVADTA